MVRCVDQQTLSMRGINEGSDDRRIEIDWALNEWRMPEFVGIRCPNRVLYYEFGGRRFRSYPGFLGLSLYLR